MSLLRVTHTFGCGSAALRVSTACQARTPQRTRRRRPLPRLRKTSTVCPGRRRARLAKSYSALLDKVLDSTYNLTQNRTVRRRQRNSHKEHYKEHYKERKQCPKTTTNVSLL